MSLTALGWLDRPAASSAYPATGGWTLREIGGRTFVEGGRCASCHAQDGMTDPLEMMPSARGPEWLAGHIMDPEMIAPGLREPPVAVGERETAAMVAYVRKLARASYPSIDQRTQMAASVFARHCIGCHVVDVRGATRGPALSRIGAERDEASREVDCRPGVSRCRRRDAVLRAPAEPGRARGDRGYLAAGSR